MKDPFFHCSKCETHVNDMIDSGKYLKRTSPLGQDFIGECAPCCEFHELRTNGSTSLINCLDDQANSK